MLVSRGVSPWLALRSLHQAATELAFRKWHLSRGERPKRAQKSTSEDYYRQRIFELRMRLAPYTQPGYTPGGAPA